MALRKAFSGWVEGKPRRNFGNARESQHTSAPAVSYGFPMGFLWVSYGFQVAISPQTHEIRGCARQECDAKVVDLQEEVPRLRCSDGLRIWEVNSRVDLLLG